MARDLTRSPFPGMDPYVERSWVDVRHAMCTYTADQLRIALPPGLICRIDIRTFTQNRLRESTDESITEGFVQVLDIKNHHRIVTVIDFSSIENKTAGIAREMYKSMHRSWIEAGTSVLEVDLIRSGDWNFRIPLAEVPAKACGLYNVCITRGSRQRRCELYPIELQDRLAKVPVPLRATDADAVLDLQPLFDRAYEHGSYGLYTDYTTAPVPPLPEAEAKWASEHLRSKL